MAGAMTLLAWGGIDFRDAYEAPGQFEYLLGTVKWATDYFIKCHISPNELYGQVGPTSEDKMWIVQEG